jgi:hypothetical protein
MRFRLIDAAKKEFPVERTLAMLLRRADERRLISPMASDPIVSAITEASMAKRLLARQV